MIKQSEVVTIKALLDRILQCDNDMRLLRTKIKRYNYELKDEIKKQDSIKKELKNLLEDFNLSSYKNEMFKITIRKGMNRVICDENFSNHKYMRTYYEPNKTLISKDLKLGIAIDGARLEKQEDTIIIKPNLPSVVWRK